MFAKALPLAREFINRNARLLDRRLFAALFEGAPKQPVLDALRAYQNPDGGFGSALEADLRTPASQPLAVEIAFFYLDLIDAFDDPMVLHACDFLDSISSPNGGVPFAVEGIDGYPHTEWMEPSTTPHLNPTASLAGLLLKHRVSHPWVERASAFCLAGIETFSGSMYHDVLSVVCFLTYTPNQTWASAQLQRILDRLPSAGTIGLDPNITGYWQFPQDWAPLPTSPLRPLFDQATIDLHLRALAARQQPDGGWPITWQALGTGAEYEWRGWVTIQNLLKLRDNA